MKLHHPSAEIFVPDGRPLAEATARITHLGIGAHQDDLEFMALHGILACYDTNLRWFGGVTCTNGAGSFRAGSVADLTPEQLQVARRKEQNAAAVLGRYGVMVQLDHSSHEIKQASAPHLEADLREILVATRPQVVYTHNLADKHGTHVAVAVAVLRAIRTMAADDRPSQVLGCEMWRGLDWMLDRDKVVLDVSGHDEFAAALTGVFASQIAGGKRYDRATSGRRAANATFLDPHAPDRAEQIILAMDLTPLIQDDAHDPAGFVDSFVARFRAEVMSQLCRSP